MKASLRIEEIVDTLCLLLTQKLYPLIICIMSKEDGTGAKVKTPQPPKVNLERLNKTKSAVFLNCRFSLFLKNLFFKDYLEVATADVVSCLVSKTSHRTSI